VLHFDLEFTRLLDKTMKLPLTLPLAVCLTMLATVAFAQKPSYPPEMQGARAEVYRSTDTIDLEVWIFEPQGHGTDDARPSMVFYFGGGWNGGTPGQFKPQAQYLAERGMVAIAVDYRVKSRHGTPAKVAVSDAKAAIRWVRTHAARLGIDPQRIAAAGGSAGGHLAAATATLPGHDDSQSVAAVSSVPNALVLFNPVLMTAPYRDLSEKEEQKFKNFQTRLGADPESMSPFHHVRPGLPPTIIFHGENDKTVPYQQAELFCDAMTAAANRCELVGYPGMGHGFFNAHRADNSAYRDTIARMDDFLVSLGWLVERQDASGDG
jgi:acetyl esterase/lipase